jgi:hypothetical protein
MQIASSHSHVVAVAAAWDPAEEALGQWVRHADTLFTSCRDSPPCMAFLLDQVTHRLALASPAGGGGGGGEGMVSAEDDGSGCGQLPRACTDWLCDKVYVSG